MHLGSLWDGGGACCASSFFFVLSDAGASNAVRRLYFICGMVLSRPALTNLFGSPIMRFLGGVPERSKGSDCKSDGIAFVGSNPAPSSVRNAGVV